MSICGPKKIDNMIIFYKNNDYDYIRNVDETTNFAIGFEMEIFSFIVLEKVYNLDKTKEEKKTCNLFLL